MERNRTIKLDIRSDDVMCGPCEFADNTMQMCTIFLQSIKIGRVKDCTDAEIKIREEREET